MERQLIIVICYCTFSLLFCAVYNEKLVFVGTNPGKIFDSGEIILSIKDNSYSVVHRNYLKAVGIFQAVGHI